MFGRLILIAVAVACLAIPQPVVNTASIANACALTADERLLYDFVLRLQYFGPPPDVEDQGLGLLCETTLGPSMSLGEISALFRYDVIALSISEERTTGLAENLLRRNEVPCHLPGSLSYAITTTMLSDGALEAFSSDVDSDAWWNAFAKKYPCETGYRRLSRIGFSDDKSIAAVYTSVRCGSHCENRTVYVFERRGAGWRIVNEHSL
jgi:hypothetical protein